MMVLYIGIFSQINTLVTSYIIIFIFLLVRTITITQLRLVASALEDVGPIPTSRVPIHIICLRVQ